MGQLAGLDQGIAEREETASLNGKRFTPITQLSI